jgi:hypothetical protein
VTFERELLRLIIGMVAALGTAVRADRCASEISNVTDASERCPYRQTKSAPSGALWIG